jgi:DNA polymerase-3 subunit gamma/tau
VTVQSAHAPVAALADDAGQAPVQPPSVQPPNLPARQVLPPGQVLPVRATHRALAGAPQPSDHTVPGPVVAVPVRVQADSRSEAAAGQAVSAPLVPTEEGAFWHTTVTQLVADEAITALVRELALQSQLVARDTDQWVLRVERESLRQNSTRERLAQALQAAGHPVHLAVEIGRVTDSPARRNAAAAAERLLVAERIIFEDPFVQTMMRDFGAKIVPGSIKPL